MLLIAARGVKSCNVAGAGSKHL